MGEKGAIAMSSQVGQRKVDVENPQLGSSNSWANSEDSVTKRNICVTIVDLVNHILIVSLTLFTLYYTVGPSVSQIHATLCTLGYILMMSEAIVVFAGDGVLTNFLTHRAKKHLHWVLQTLGLILVIAGFVPMYLAKDSNPRPHHFKSYHAILGITSMVVMVFLTVTGYPVFVAAKLRQVVRPIVIKFSHNFLGISCFVIGMASQCLGYKMYRSMNTPSVDVTTICIIVCVAITLLSVRKALPSLVQQSVRLFR